MNVRSARPSMACILGSELNKRKIKNKKTGIFTVIQILKGAQCYCVLSLNSTVICQNLRIRFLIYLNTCPILWCYFGRLLKKLESEVCVGVERVVLKTAQLFLTSCPHIPVMPRRDLSNQLPHTHTTTEPRMGLPCHDRPYHFKL